VIGSNFARKKELKHLVKESEFDIARQQQQGKVAGLQRRVEDLENDLSLQARDLSKYKELFDLAASQDQMNDLIAKIT
jgi:hypothetical protein